MAGELFKSMAGCTWSTSRTGAQRRERIGGQVDVMFDAVTTMAEQIVRLRHMLATTRTR
jgi:hypothetical protein